MELNHFNYNYEVKYNDDSSNSDERWKLYLFKGLKGNLRKRLDEMISHSEYELFFTALRLEYGYNTPRNLDQAFQIYKETSMANSTNYLSMARLYEIYRTQDEKFKSKIKNDKNLELIYLFKSFAYLPLSVLRLNSSHNIFPFDLAYIVASFLDNNNLKDTKKISRYIDELMNSGKYNEILSQNDCNLIKGFIEAFFGYQYEENNVNSINLLLALSLEGYLEASAKLIYIYYEKLDQLNKKNENQINQIESLKTKIYDLFLSLEKEKYYKIYAQYGLFLYHEMRMFDKALEIFKEGYDRHQYDCSLYYFHAFTKSKNQVIYEQNNFDSEKFINIFQCLIDAFIFGKYHSLYNMFDYLHIIGKKYNLMAQLSNKYMKYLNEIALLCTSFVNKEKGIENIKHFTLNAIDSLKYASFHALSIIHMYGLTTEVQMHLVKAERFLKLLREKDKYTQPYYTRLIYKIRKKLFNLGAIADKREIEKYEKTLFQLYDKYKHYENYGNSYYYYFGRLYEKGIGTEKNNTLALQYYKRGCKSLHNLHDSFVIVYKRFLSLKIINSNKFNNNLSSIPNKIYNIKFRLSSGNIDIFLPINIHMPISDIKNELYKRPELQNYEIKVLLFKGNQLMDSDKLEKYKINDNETVTVIVGVPDASFY